MKYLLDTHILLWSRLEPSKLPLAHRALLRSPDDQIFISTITIWEISLKFSLGKLDLGTHTPEEFLRSAQGLGIEVITPTPEQFASFHRLPAVVGHKDPFDRMLIWHAMQSGLSFLSNDRELPKYKIHGLLLA